MSRSGAAEHGRERNKRRTRRALRAAVLDLGLDRGLENVTVEQISERAGVSPRTFFNYFPTKEDAALVDLFSVPADSFAALVNAGGPPTVWSDVETVFTQDVERAVAENADLIRHLELQQRNPHLHSRQLQQFSRFEAALAAAITLRLRDYPNAAVRAQLIAGSGITAVRVGLAQWAASDRARPLSEHVRDALDLLAPAFLLDGTNS